MVPYSSTRSLLNLENDMNFDDLADWIPVPMTDEV
jgi:hypothetical protein